MSVVRDWHDVRLKDLFTSIRNGTWGDDPDDETDVFCARGTDFDRTTSRISDARMPRRNVELEVLKSHQLKRGDLVLEKSGGSADQPVGSVAIFDLDRRVVCSNFNARMKVASSVEPRFACYLINGLYWSGFTRQFVNQTTGIQNLDAGTLLAQRVALPPFDEQCCIADFLDFETGNLDRMAEIRERQLHLAAQRLRQIVDGVMAGDGDALTEIEFRGNVSEWKMSKVGRLFSVIPGYAFPSRDFVESDAGTRLIRGINVTPGRIDWHAETFSWDLESSPVHRRFHLTFDDLVIGLDRPWIGSGVRVALIREVDLPSLLLQRVACIRSRTESITRYLRWVLSSVHFRAALEGETTGVSVPHISGDQVSSFTYRLPSPREQHVLAATLQREDDLNTEQAKLMKVQLALLAERRQALIAAAVTGQIDVTTARGVAT